MVGITTAHFYVIVIVSVAVIALDVVFVFRGVVHNEVIARVSTKKTFP